MELKEWELDVQFILSTSNVCICKYANSLKHFCKPQINTCVTCSHLQTCIGWCKIWVAYCAYSLLRSNKAMFYFPASVFKLKPSVLSTVYLVPCFHLFVIFWWFHCLKWPPNSVPKCKKTVMCLMEKICVLDNFIQVWIIMLFINCEFNINGSTICFN